MEEQRKKVFGKKIKDYRLARGETQDDIAKVCCVVRSAVSNWELGRRVPDVEIVKILIKHFGINTEELLYDLYENGNLGGENIINIQIEEPKTINFENLYEVNWGATGDNVRFNILSLGINNETFAEMMNISISQIDLWCDGKLKIDNSDIKLLSKIFNCEVEDLYVYNNQLISKNEIYKILEDKKQEIKLKNRNDASHEEFPINDINEVIYQIAINGQIKMSYPIKTKNELLIYLPLVDLHSLNDVMSRIKGSGYEYSSYILEQLKYLYECIPNIKARSYADRKIEFEYDYPKISEIDDLTKRPEKIQKWGRWENYIKDSTSEDAVEYEKECEKFLKKIGLFEELSFMLNLLK